MNLVSLMFQYTLHNCHAIDKSFNLRVPCIVGTKTQGLQLICCTSKMKCQYVELYSETGNIFSYETESDSKNRDPIGSYSFFNSQIRNWLCFSNIAVFIADCPQDHFGPDCAYRCYNCSKGWICDPKFGCCPPNAEDCRQYIVEKQSKGLLGTEYAKADSQTGTVVPIVVVVFLVAILLLALGVYYYRRKYHRARDPPGPTIT